MVIMLTTENSKQTCFCSILLPWLSPILFLIRRKPLSVIYLNQKQRLKKKNCFFLILYLGLSPYFKDGKPSLLILPINLRAMAATRKFVEVSHMLLN